MERTKTTPRKAAGTEAMASQAARFQRTVPRPAWTAAPTGFMIREATRSLETAARGWMPKMSTRMGVIKRAAPHAGEADGEADDQPGQRDKEIDMHP